MKNIQKNTLQQLQTLRVWVARAEQRITLDEKEKQSLSKALETIDKEISKRLQLTLDFKEDPRQHQWHCGDNCMCDKCKKYGIGSYFTTNEPEDGAYAD